MLLKSKLTSTLQSMALFLANKDTEYILFKPVKVINNQHLQRDPDFVNLYRKTGSKNGG